MCHAQAETTDSDARIIPCPISLYITGPSQCPRVDKPHLASITSTRLAVAAARPGAAAESQCHRDRDCHWQWHGDGRIKIQVGMKPHTDFGWQGCKTVFDVTVHWNLNHRSTMHTVDTCRTWPRGVTATGSAVTRTPVYRQYPGRREKIRYSIEFHRRRPFLASSSQPATIDRRGRPGQGGREHNATMDQGHEISNRANQEDHAAG